MTITGTYERSSVRTEVRWDGELNVKLKQVGVRAVRTLGVVAQDSPGRWTWRTAIGLYGRIEKTGFGGSWMSGVRGKRKAVDALLDRLVDEGVVV